MTEKYYPSNHPLTIYPTHACLPITGSIKTEKLSMDAPDCIFWYDMPICFMGEWNGQRRMFQVIDEGQPGQLYADSTMRMTISTPTEKQVAALLANTLPFRDVITAGELFIAEVKNDYSIVRVWEIDAFSDDDLPKAGLFLSPT